MTLASVSQLADRFTFLLIGAALVVVAYLVNRFAPRARKHIRRTLFVYGVYVLALTFAFALGHAGAAKWAMRATTVAAFLEAYSWVSLGGLALFDLALPAVGLALVSITSDIALGIAYIVTTLGVARSLGMDPSAVVATSAIVSGVLALSLQATLGNILGGVALQLDGSIHVGDWVQLENGRQGKVKEIRWRHTVIETRDWSTIIVPNASLLASNIMILAKREGAPAYQRMWVYFNVDFRYPPQQVIDAVTDALRGTPIPNVASDPPAQCICFDFARDMRDSFAYYAVRYWLTDLALDDPTSSAVRARIYAGLRRADIPLARPAQTLFLTPNDATEEDRRKERHLERRRRAVRSMDLFRGLTDEEYELLAAHLRWAPFSRGETMTKQGAVAHWLYILAQGEADIRMRIEGSTRIVAHLTAPNFFGEMGLMTGEPRSADVVATTDCECYRLDKESFERIVHDRPEVAKSMSENMAKRRVELFAARENLDSEAKARRERSEQERILARIQDFFGLTS